MVEMCQIKLLSPPVEFMMDVVVKQQPLVSFFVINSTNELIMNYTHHPNNSHFSKVSILD